MKILEIELSDVDYGYLVDKWSIRYEKDKTLTLKQYINSKISEMIHDEKGREMTKADQYEGISKVGTVIEAGERTNTIKFP